MNDTVDPPTITDFREGDVVRYESIERPNRWCREEVAVGQMRPSPRVDGEAAPHLALVDTYWGLSGGDRHHLTQAEVETAEVLFNLNDVEQIDGHSDFARRTKWERYSEADRFVLTSQHRLQQTYYVRRGAAQDRSAELEQQRRAIEDAIQKRDSALSDLQFQRDRFHQMLADPAVRPWAV